MLCYACALPTMLYLVPTTILLGEMQGCGCRHEKLGLVFGWPRLDSLCRRFEFCWKWLLYYYDALWANFSHIQHYCTGQRKRARISAPIILSKLLEPANRPLAGPSSLERIIGAEIRALFL